MKGFLCELFDIPDISCIKDINSLFDLDAQSLIYERIYHNAQIRFSLLFTHIWYQCFGIYPNKCIVYNVYKSYFRFLHSKVISSQEKEIDINFVKSEVDYIYSFIHEKTFFKYIGKPGSNYHEKTNVFIEKIKDESNIKSILEEKLINRLLPYIKFMNSPKCIKKEDITGESLYKLYQNLIHSISKNEEQFYSDAKSLINKDQLLYQNIYTQFILYPQDDLIKLEDWYAINPIEAIQYQIIQDYYFLRTIFLKPVIISFSQKQSNLSHDIYNSLLQYYTKEDIIYFGCRSETFNNCPFLPITSHSDEKSVKEGNFSEYSFVFDACVPRILGHIFWINPEISDTINGHLPEKAFHFQNPYQQICIHSLTTDNILYHTQIINYRNIFVFYWMHSSSHQNNDYIQAYLNTYKNSIFVPSEINVLKDYILNIIKLITAKTGRENHFSKTFLYAKSFIYKYIIQNNIIINVSSYNNDVSIKPYCIFYIDTRPNILGVISIAITLANLNKNQWDIVILTSDENKNFYRSYLGHNIRFLNIHNSIISENKMNIDGYNTIMKSEKTWKELDKLGYIKTLVIQDDSMILKKGLEDNFINFDYVGPPWLRCESNDQLQPYIDKMYVGNGGLSLRTVKTMLYICENYQKEKNLLFNSMLQPVQEDVYFIMCIDKINKKIKQKNIEKPEEIKVPDEKTASYFGIEQVYNRDALGIHKFWVYNTSDKIHDYFTNILNQINK